MDNSLGHINNINYCNKSRYSSGMDSYIDKILQFIYCATRRTSMSYDIGLYLFLVNTNDMCGVCWSCFM